MIKIEGQVSSFSSQHIALFSRASTVDHAVTLCSLVPIMMDLPFSKKR